MTKAINTTPPPAPMPSIFDLCLRLVTLWATLNDHDERRTRAKERTQEFWQAEADYTATNAEIDATEALIFTRPVETLADAAALASVGFRLADYLYAFDTTCEHADGIVARLRAAFGRIALRVSEAAGVPFADIAGGNDLDYVNRYTSCGEARP